MGDESEAVFLPLFDHDIHVRRCFRVEHICRAVPDMAVLEAKRMGPQPVETETAGLVAGRWEEVGEKDCDVWEKRKWRGPDINKPASC